MTISYLDYSTGEVHIIQNVPEDIDTEDYLFETLGLRDSDIYYMCGDDTNLIMENYGR